MNAEQLNFTDGIRAAVHEATAKEWSEFFESMRQAEYAQLRGKPVNELTDLQTRVKLLDELEHLFTSSRQSKAS